MNRGRKEENPRLPCDVFGLFCVTIGFSSLLVDVYVDSATTQDIFLYISCAHYSIYPVLSNVQAQFSEVNVFESNS